MKDDDTLPITTSSSTTTPLSSSSSSSSSTTTVTKKDSSSSSDANIFGKGRYKFWALAAILLLAFWSMFTGTVTLRWSAGNLNRLSDDIDTPLRDDLDVLEMEEREKVVKYMWDVYTNSRRIRLPKFWQQAFEAAYQDMTSDVPGVRHAAVNEIAKMSIRSIDLHPPPLHFTGARELSLKHAEIRKTATASGNS